MKSRDRAPMLLEFTCSQRWQEMAGDERARHCAQCDQQVINISDYSQAQINELQERIDCGEKICVAFKPVKPEPAEVLGECLSFAFAESAVGISGLLACSLTLGSFSLLALSASSAQAQDGQKQESPRKGPVVPTSSNSSVSRVVASPSLRSPKAEPGLRGNSDVSLAPSEYALVAGRPAPSFLRDTVTDLMYGRDDFFNFLPMILRFNIRQQVEKEGSINIQQIEWMASLQELQGQASDALASYRLLLALMERSHDSAEHKEVRKAELEKKINSIASKAYIAYLKDVDKGDRDGWVVRGDLIRAQEVRTLSPSARKLCPWSELALRIDRLASGANSEIVGDFALQVSAEEPQTPLLKKWRKRYIDEKVSKFARALEKGQRELASHHINDCYETLSSIPLPRDREAASLCNIDDLVSTWLSLIVHLRHYERLCGYRICINCLRNAGYHSEDEKNRIMFSKMLVDDVRNNLALSREELRTGQNVRAVSLLFEADSLANVFPVAMPESLLMEIRKRRLELGLKPTEEDISR